MRSVASLLLLLGASPAHAAGTTVWAVGDGADSNTHDDSVAAMIEQRSPDAFLYLGMQRRMDLDLTAFPLLFVGSAASFMLLAVPFGRMADRFGRERMFLAGYALLLVVYTALLVPDLGTPMLIGYPVLLGAYYAATDGVLMAAASSLLPEHSQASGLGLLVAAVTVAKLAAALLFGLLWTTAGLGVATVVFGCALTLALALAVAVIGGRGTAHV